VRGIIGYGAYVPYYRLDRSKIAAAMSAGGGRGQRSVASFDEDTTTMGVEAARNALRNAQVTPTSILFATANPAYLDKTNATAIQAALDLPQETWAVDTGGSARSAEAAMRALEVAKESLWPFCRTFELEGQQVQTNRMVGMLRLLFCSEMKMIPR